MDYMTFLLALYRVGLQSIKSHRCDDDLLAVEAFSAIPWDRTAIFDITYEYHW